MVIPENVMFIVHVLILCFFSSQVQEYHPAMDWLSSFWCAVWWGMPCYNLKNWHGLRPDLALSLFALKVNEIIACFIPSPTHTHNTHTMRTAQLALISLPLLLLHPAHCYSPLYTPVTFKPVGLPFVQTSTRHHLRCNAPVWKRTLYLVG